MPERDYTWLPKRDILTFEELERLARVFASLGVQRIRLTGGEPLLRKGIAHLVERLHTIDGIEEISMTTNGVLLARHARTLKNAGLDRITLSLDSLEPDTYRRTTGVGSVENALTGLQAAHDAGFQNTKINAVIIHGVNDHELVPMLHLGNQTGSEVRFIEYMDVGGATGWQADKVLSIEDMLKRLSDKFGTIRTLPSRGSSPAARFRLPSGQTFGIIASTTQPFCSDCDRARLTADGRWLLCLYDPKGVDLRQPLRNGLSDENLATHIGKQWSRRDLRGAETRIKTQIRGVWVEKSALKANPHLEMHTRGG